MTLAAMLRLAFALLFASFHHVSADFDILEFPSNATDYICPGMDFACVAPAICAHEFVTDQYFCCFPIGGACTTTAQTCGIPSKPSPLALYNSAPLPTQQACDLSNASGYCCDKFQQQCAGDDSTACWSDRTNLIQNISNSVMNRTFSALTSANPSATAYTVKIEDLALGIIPTSILSANTNPPSSLPHPKEGSKALSSSEIGGIVGGVVGGLLLSGLAILLSWRRQQIAKRAHGLAMQRESLSSSDDIPDLPEIKQPIIAEAPAQESYDAQELTAAGQLPVESPTDRQLPVEAHGDERHPFEVEANTPIELDGTTASPRDMRSDPNTVETDYRKTSRDTSTSDFASP